MKIPLAARSTAEYGDTRASTRASEDAYSFGRTFGLTWAVLVALLLIVGRDYYAGSALYETGDLAANALQIERARELGEIYGNYSRFRFHHPGPAFFYVYAAAEVLLLDILRVVPAAHNAHLIGGAVLQAGFLAAGIAALARYGAPHRRLFVALAVAIAMVHFGLVDHMQLSLWPPMVLIWPAAAFLMLAISVGLGRLALLPVLATTGGFLVHGHVAQPLFVLPVCILAWAFALARIARTESVPLSQVLRKHIVSHAVTTAVVGLFLLPIGLDAIQGGGSNLSAILATLNAERSPEDRHSFTTVLRYVLAFGGYPVGYETLEFSNAEFIAFVRARWILYAALIIACVFAPIRAWASLDSFARRRARALVLAFGMTLTVASVLTVAWAAIQRGLLYQFNSLFIYGIMYVALLCGPLLRSMSPRPLRPTWAPALVVVLTAVVALTTETPTLAGEDPGASRLRAAAATLVRDAPPPAAGVLLTFPDALWPAAVATALVLERADVPWYVDPSWEFMFGQGHGSDDLAGAQPIEWRFSPPSDDQPGQVRLSDSAAVTPQPGGE